MAKRLNLKTTQEVRRSLTRIANMLLNDEIEPKKANALTFVCNAVLGSLKADEQIAISSERLRYQTGEGMETEDLNEVDDLIYGDESSQPY
ncbi:hypothetical protein Q5O24_09090 [Eubacteriaceae bacterium ES3]|nr:hypothetical protein Q5O24_09090 [Eubacteriaceae bacterium ES3]